MNITYEEAKEILKEFLSQNVSDTDEEELKDSIKQVLLTKGKELGLDFNVEFVDSEEFDGIFLKPEETEDGKSRIKISNYLIEEAFSMNPAIKAACLRTAFHELNHAIQYDNIQNGIVDYNTYCMILDDIIEKYTSPDFYNNNHDEFNSEKDSMLEEMFQTIKFFDEIGLAENSFIYQEVIEEFHDELNYHYHKTSGFILDDEEVELSRDEVIKILIQRNPDILQKEPFLRMAYDQNGEPKDIYSLIDEFFILNDGLKEPETNINYDGIYLIYYFLVNEQAAKQTIIEPELEEKIKQFNNYNLVSVLNQRSTRIEKTTNFAGSKKILREYINRAQITAFYKKLQAESVKQK